MKKIFYVSIILTMFVLASCSKEDAKENTACIAQCLLAKENGQDFAGCNNEERTIQNEKLNIILKRLEKQDSVLITLKGGNNARTGSHRSRRGK